MNRLIYVFHDSLCYEVLLNESIVARIKRYKGNDQLGVELQWDQLDTQVQDKIVKEYRKKR